MLTPKRFAHRQRAREQAAARAAAAEQSRVRNLAVENRNLLEELRAARNHAAQAQAALARVYRAIPDGSMLKPPVLDEWTHANEHDEFLRATPRYPKRPDEARYIDTAAAISQRLEVVTLERLALMSELDWKATGWHVMMRLGRGRDIAIFLEVRALFARPPAERAEYLRMVVAGAVDRLIVDMAQALRLSGRGW